MLTEQEAREKWCPQMARHSLMCDETCRRKPEDYAPGIVTSRCIASDCMAWRWSHAMHYRNFRACDNASALAEPSPYPEGIPANWEWRPFDEAEGNRAGWLEPKADADARRRGYCGLAGRPA